MDTEVYLLCNTCNGLTNGIGSGDSEDFIKCASCGTQVKAHVVGEMKPYGGKALRLYIETDKFSNLIELEK